MRVSRPLDLRADFVALWISAQIPTYSFFAALSNLKRSAFASRVIAWGTLRLRPRFSGLLRKYVPAFMKRQTAVTLGHCERSVQRPSCSFLTMSGGFTFAFSIWSSWATLRLEKCRGIASAGGKQIPQPLESRTQKRYGRVQSNSCRQTRHSLTPHHVLHANTRQTIRWRRNRFLVEASVWNDHFENTCSSEVI